jgi:putative oxidoreductase
MSFQKTFLTWLVRLAGLGVGGVFICAGALKVGAPLAFADSVASFRLLPVALINPVALSLPIFEVVVGLSLVVGVRRRACAMMIAVMCGVFAVALIQALARGIEVDCGCFGGGVPSTAKTVWSLVRDLCLGALAWWVARRSPGGEGR